MTYSTQEIVERLLTDIAAMQKVQAIGISGDISSYPKAGEGDIDVFALNKPIFQAVKGLWILSKDFPQNLTVAKKGYSRL